jgi:hypothetical protein
MVYGNYGNYGESTMRRADLVEKSFAVGAAVRTAVRPRAGESADTAEQSHAAASYWSGCLAVVIWSLSYLIRQPGVATSALGASARPFSPVGDFALEGMLLALAWLAVLAVACIAVLTGAARIEEPRD